jgi:hypothetical protein
MKQFWLSLASWLVLGLLPLNEAHAQQRSAVRVALPGTIEPVIVDHIGPAFTAATGYPLEALSRPINRTHQSDRQRRTQTRRLHQFRRESDEVVVRTG